MTSGVQHQSKGLERVTERMGKLKAFYVKEAGAFLIGGNEMILIGGPCSIERWEVCDEVAGYNDRIEVKVK